MITNIAALPGLNALWEQTQGDPRIRVAILDGPVDRLHPCFQGAALTALPTLVPDTAGNGRMSGHGTHIASMILGQPGGPVPGIAPGCSGLIVPIFSDHSQGPTSQIDLARAINQAVEAGAHVINISGGELSNAGSGDPILASAVRASVDQGVLIVAAAGNDACRCLHVPAALPSVLAVGALDGRGLPLDLSNWGDIYQSQGVLAPGENMLGASPGGATTLKTGTSFAAPVVSGIAALLLSLQLARGLRPDPRAVRAAILESATRCDEKLFADCQRFLVGSLNIPGAYNLITTRRRNPMSDETRASDVLAADGVDRLQPSESLDGGESAPSESSETAALQPSETVVPAAAPPMNAAREAVARRECNAAPSGKVAASHRSAAVVPSACGCQGNGSARSLVFAIGTIGYDFGTEARRDGFRQLMPRVTIDGTPYVPEDRPPERAPYPPNPYDPRQMVNYLTGFPPPAPPFPTAGGFPVLAPQFPPPVTAPHGKYAGYPAHLSEAAELIWTLNIELTPIYAIQPTGNFSAEVYQRLVEFLAGQIRDPQDEAFVSRVSIPGVLTGGTVKLFSGEVVPVVEPRVRGMYAWHESQLVTQVLAARNVDLKSDEAAVAQSGIRNFLDRVYYDLRNLGQSSAERALNFSATNAFQTATAFTSPGTRGMFLQNITTERSPFCRKDSDCWDVKLRFFDPGDQTKAGKVFRFTVDVSVEYPVTIGPVREWDVPGVCFAPC